jgi:hypothetical protein
LAQGPEEKLAFFGLTFGNAVVMITILSDGRLPLGGGVPRMEIGARRRFVKEK